MTVDLSPRKIFAHRGFSSRHPEMTVAAYRAAIAFARDQEIELGLECDVHFSADDELICLHDLVLDRTGSTGGPAFELTVGELKQVDFGSWFTDDPTPDEQRLVTLAEVLDLVAEGCASGADVTLNLETKHPNPRGADTEDRVLKMLTERGWDGPDSPIQLITFDLDALHRFGRLMPNLTRTLLIEIDLGEWRDGTLPDGVKIAGPDVRLLRADPDYVARARSHGNEVHPWTVNKYEDIEFCLDLGVTGFTTDFPDRVLEVLTR